MKYSIRGLFSFLSMAALPFALLVWVEWNSDVQANETAISPLTVNYDIRADVSGLEGFKTADQTSDLAGKSNLRRVRQAAENLKQVRPELTIDFNPLTGSAEVIATDVYRTASPLTAPATGPRTEILRAFLKRNAGLFGLDDAAIDALKVSADYTNPAGNISYVQLEQSINGVPVFGGVVKAGFTPRNEIVRIINGLAPVSEEALPTEFGDREPAVRRFLEARKGAVVTDVSPFYFPFAGGAARPAWRFLVESGLSVEYFVVDAETGVIFWRKDLVDEQTQTATFEVYGSAASMIKTADSPAPGTPGCPMPAGCPQPTAIPRMQFTLIGNEPPYAFNNLGWIADGETRTIGNNVEAGIDRDGITGIDPNGWAFGNPNRNFVFSFNPGPGLPPPGEEPLPTTQTYPPTAFQQGSVTHAFYVANRWHDETYRLGFTEAALNFQTDNFGRGGSGGDSISFEVQDGSGTNGANFATPADGQRPRGQMFVWTGPTPDRDGALDSQVVTHELTHGMSNRLHGNAIGLSSNMARGMGEGWSDFYALALLSEPTDDPCGTNAVAGYITHQIVFGFEGNYYYGIRRFPSARRQCLGPNGLPHNPLTFRYINSGCNTLIGTTTSNPPPNSAYPRGPIGVTTCDQTHNIGEIWSAGLWEVRGELIGIHGPAEGNRRALQYITDGMKLSPINPTMLQSRDAIIAAASVTSPTDALAVRRGFAIRGMGISASIQNTGTGNNNTAVTESFDGAPTPSPSVRADFDGDGRSDISVFRPSEGIWYENRSNAGFAALRWGLADDRIAPGDFDGDGKTDIAVFRAAADPAFPDFYVLRSSDSSYAGFSWGLPGDVPVVADYDGDGRSDIAVFRPSTHTFYVLRSSNGNVLTYSGIAFGVPVTGDFDGDGKADFASYSIDGWFLSQSNINYASVTFVRFGASGDRPVPGDYDGDARDDFAVFRPSDRTWYIRKSSGGVAYAQFGISTDEPVPADYDGDGKTDVAVFRDGDWYVDQSTGGFFTMHFGLSGDVPVQKGYLP